MIIGIDASRANREFKTGTEWYSFYLIKELVKIDSSNQYVLYSDRPLTAALAKIVSRHDNVKAKILNWPLGYLWTQVRLSWEMLFHAPDVLFIPAHTLPYIHPRKSVVTIHDVGFKRVKELYSSDKIGPSGGTSSKVLDILVKLFAGGESSARVLDYHGWSTKFALKYAEKIIAVSGFTKKELINYYSAPEDKITVVCNGFNDALYQPIADSVEIKQVLNKYGIESPYIFYVGRLDKKKNIAGLVNAFAAIKEKYKNFNYKLVLVGNAGLDFDEIKYVIEDFDLDDEVIITGWVPEEDMPYVYSGASLFVFPSFYEGFGIPLLQAMAMGVPIAASDIGAIVEVTAGAARLFNPSDKDDMAEKIVEVLLDDKLAKDLIKRGRIRVKDFSLNRCARETLAVIENIN